MKSSINFAIVLFFIAIGITTTEKLHKHETKKDKSILTAEDFIQPRRKPRQHYVYLRNPASGLVLEAKPANLNITFVHATGVSSQLWAPEYLGKQKFNIINKGNGKYIELNKFNGTLYNLVTKPKRAGDPLQQWYLSYDNIVNEKLRWTISVPVHDNEIKHSRHGVMAVVQPPKGIKWQDMILQIV
ncbi:uncharacterized protein LOC103313782 [Tribolium castaneum]|uniref:Ricin B lectin domain-containing protein n=1 Tax=Tribolium castaneum TaxID=7070 RepID=A0A139WDU3_TRICA|nr:PREDICTED: uncharacterized protein LOC103313782 [Tribolium castaneum]KYB26096.1 hypothetical protein TcasGA2_TC033965 [Tribolium castaneum]|eukprot:XP_008196170.1 PREDICTED: uncharacterized protein LOC103313782 [Tribolium castaneum]